MKRNLLILIPLVLAVGACSDLKNSAVNVYDSLYDMGETGAEVAGVGAAATPDRLINEGQCPVADVVPELGDYYEMPPGSPLGASNFSSMVNMIRAEATCEYGVKSMTIDVKIGFKGKPGPTSSPGGTKTYPYFVSVLSPGQKILAKKIFSVNIDYSTANPPIVYQRLRQIVPIENQKFGASHKVLFGFQLSADQLAHNRELIRAKERAQKQFEIEQNQIIRERSPAQSGVNPPPVITMPPKTSFPSEITIQAPEPIILAPEDAQ
jgi:hypothetical protein